MYKFFYILIFLFTNLIHNQINVYITTIKAFQPTPKGGDFKVFLFWGPACQSEAESRDLGDAIKIRILSNYIVTSCTIASSAGEYEVWANDEKKFILDSNNAVLLNIINNSISLNTLKNTFGTFNNISIKGISTSPSGKYETNYLDLIYSTPASGGLNRKSYYGDLHINLTNNRLILINEVGFDDYIAGVVEAEVGYSDFIEYYKTKAILVRTYTFEQMNRHIDEGFNLCDDVHCQVYGGKCSNSKIIQAVQVTQNIVIISTVNGQLITPTFYSNCGGQTVNSEDVWLEPRSYLKTVKDPYCLEQKSAKWELKIPTKKWLNYLNKYTKIDSANYIKFLYFNQEKRIANFERDNLKIPLTQIRKDWNFRSTFFSYAPLNDDTLLFTGRGYGHGVGLCQEGAKRMAELGHSYKDIIHFYYKNVKIVRYDDND